MKNKKSVRVKAERGYGPRHAFNAQEGSEAVPGELPSPPAEDLSVKRNSLGNLRPAAMLQALKGELSGLSKEDVAKLGISLLVGGEGPEPLPPTGKVWGHVSDIGEPLPTTKELQAKNQDWLDAQGKDFEVQDDGSLKPVQSSRFDYKAQIDPSTAAYDPSDPFTDAQWKQQQANLDAMTPEERQAHINRMLGDPPDPQEWWKSGGRPPSPEGMKRGKVAVAKGFGPMHAENAKEGEDLTKQNTDTVPAMLTPREAVLNRNAAELAGRGKIEALNAEGNQLARKGVDLAAGGMTSVKEKIMKSKPKSSKPASSGSPYVQAFQKLMPKQAGGAQQPVGYEQGVGGVPSPMPPYSTSGGGRPAPAPMPAVRPMPRPGGGMPDPLQHQGGFNMANINQAAAGLPTSMGGAMQPPQVPPYPVFGGRGYAGGSAEVAQGPIGTPPQNEQAFGPPVQLTAPQIQAAAKQAGLSQGQIAGLMKAFQGGQQAYNSIGSSGTPDAASMFSDAGTGYQGGISDIGYPPFVAPSANYDGNRGGWLGPYDPSFMIQRYAGGISSVPFR